MWKSKLPSTYPPAVWRPLARRYQRAISRADSRWSTPAQLASMAVGLALCYRSGELPLILAGLLLYGVLATRRIDLALLFVPLTAPLFLISAVLPNTSAPELLLPPHEFAVLTAAAAPLL